MLTTTRLAAATDRDVAQLREDARRHDVSTGALPRLRMFTIRRDADNLLNNVRVFADADLVAHAERASAWCAWALTSDVPPGDPETIIARDHAMVALLAALDGHGGGELN